MTAEPRRPQSWAAALAWRVLNALQLVLLGSWTAAWITLAVAVTALKGDARASLGMARRFWAPGVLAGLGVRLDVAAEGGTSSLAPVVFVANHRSNLDVPVLFAALPADLRFLVKAEFARVPFLGWYVKRMGMVLVDRASPTTARRSLREMQRILGNGNSLVAFPEGTRGSEEGVGPFKVGVFAAAIRAGARVIPVAIRGSGAAWAPHTIAGRPGRVQVTIGSPLDTAGLGRGDAHELAETARRRIEQLLRHASLVAVTSRSAETATHGSSSG
jgi:1-acyl-sn-glycerol-3-phosphate acyltransferase